MDRFIDAILDVHNEKSKDLKSNMDRFIATVYKDQQNTEVI